MNNRLIIRAHRGFDLRYVARVALGDYEQSADPQYHGCLITAAMANPGTPKIVEHMGEVIGTLSVSGWSVEGPNNEAA